MSRRKRTLCRAAKGVIPYSRKPYWKRVDKEGGVGRVGVNGGVQGGGEGQVVRWCWTHE